MPIEALRVLRDGSVMILASVDAPPYRPPKQRWTLGQGDGTVTLEGLKTVKRRGKLYRYFKRRGAPLIKLPDLPTDHPDFLRSYADARKAVPEKAPVAAGSFAALVRAALISDKFRQSRPATRAMFKRHYDDLVAEFGPLPARGLRSKLTRTNLPTAASQGHRLRTWWFL